MTTSGDSEHLRNNSQRAVAFGGVLMPTHALQRRFTAGWLVVMTFVVSQYVLPIFVGGPLGLIAIIFGGFIVPIPLLALPVGVFLARWLDRERMMAGGGGTTTTNADTVFVNVAAYLSALVLLAAGVQYCPKDGFWSLAVGVWQQHDMLWLQGTAVIHALFFIAIGILSGPVLRRVRLWGQEQLAAFGLCRPLLYRCARCGMIVTKAQPQCHGCGDRF